MHRLMIHSAQARHYTVRSPDQCPGVPGQRPTRTPPRPVPQALPPPSSRASASISAEAGDPLRPPRRKCPENCLEKCPQRVSEPVYGVCSNTCSSQCYVSYTVPPSATGVLHIYLYPHLKPTRTPGDASELLPSPQYLLCSPCQFALYLPGYSPTIPVHTERHRPGRLGQARLDTADQAPRTHGLTDCETILVGIPPGVYSPTQLSPGK